MAHRYKCHLSLMAEWVASVVAKVRFILFEFCTYIFLMTMVLSHYNRSADQSDSQHECWHTMASDAHAFTPTHTLNVDTMSASECSTDDNLRYFFYSVQLVRGEGGPFHLYFSLFFFSFLGFSNGMIRDKILLWSFLFVSISMHIFHFQYDIVNGLPFLNGCSLLLLYLISFE